jgi:hypothetical protein
VKANKQIMVHSYVTDGYMDYAELFLESLKIAYNEEIHVKIDSCNLSEDKIDRLRKIYNNIDIRNKNIDYEILSNNLNVELKTVLRWKKEIEMSRTTEKNYLFKVFISVDQRYRSLDKVIDEAKKENYDYLLHLDIDIYFRKKFIEKLITTMKNFDLGVYFNNSNEHAKKYWGGFICFNLKGSLDSFVHRWMSEIDKYPLQQRWKGFGQSVLYYAIENDEYLKIVNLSEDEKSPTRSNKFDVNADFWQGSNSQNNIISQNIYFIFKKIYFKLTNKNTLPFVPKKAIKSRDMCWKDLKNKSHKNF